MADQDPGLPEEQQEQPEEQAGKRSAFPLLLATLAIVTIVMVLFNRVFQAVQPDCVNSIAQTVPSPDGSLNAVLFERNCGATTGFSSHVSVLRADQQLPDQAGNAFVALDGETAGSTGWGGPAVEIDWTSADRLVLRHDPTATVSSSRESVSGVTVDSVAAEVR